MMDVDWQGAHGVWVALEARVRMGEKGDGDQWGVAGRGTRITEADYMHPKILSRPVRVYVHSKILNVKRSG